MKRFAIGVDLGGTNLRVAAVEESGQFLEKVSLPVRMFAGRDAVIAELCRAVQELSSKHRAVGSLVGVGVGVPGIIHRASGMLRQSPNLPGWENVPLRDEIESRLGTQVLLDNDANAAALGEKWLGAGRNVSSLCLLTLGTGVGGGLILDGKIWHGFLGMAGEVGHIPVAENGARCGCGSWGCLETEASATAIARKAEQALAAGRSPALAQALLSQGGLTPVGYRPQGVGGQARQEASRLSAELVYRTAEAGDAACREIFESFGRYLGRGLAALVNSLNLPLYVLGGGVAEAWDLFSPAMFDELRQRSYVFCEGSTRVEKSLLGGDAGLYGAARLALQASSAAP